MTDQPTALDKHPAKFTPAIMDKVRGVLFDEFYRNLTVPMADGTYEVRPKVLDPFGGIGGIHQLRTIPDDWSSNRTFRYDTWAVEIEPEWAAQSELVGPTCCADWLRFKIGWEADYRFRWYSNAGMHSAWLKEPVDAIVTSPTYGNRMADHHEAKDDSRRMTYRHVLGRALHHMNSGQMQWTGGDYKWFHRKAWRNANRALKPGGLFVLNVKNHVRQGKVMRVAEWHRDHLVKVLGFEQLQDIHVPVKGMLMGENHELRVQYEHVFVLRSPVKS